MAATNPDVWLDFMRGLTNVLEARSARLLVLDREGRTVHRRLAIDHDEHYLRQYVNYYVNVCPWRPELSRKPTGRMFSSYFDFSCPQSEFLESEFFHDWARPQGIYHGLLGTVFADEHQRVQLMLQREQRSGHFTEAHKQLVDLFVPHIRRACELGRVFESERGLGSAITRSAEKIPQPFLLLDERGSAVHVSPQADALLTRTEALTLRAGRLRARRPDLQRKLQSLIHSCTRAAAGAWDHTGGALRLPCRSLGELVVSAFPVHGDADAFLFAARRCFAAVYVAPTHARVQVVRDQLARLFALTPAEADLAARLAEGEALQKAIEGRGISVNTARSHLKRTFAKLHVRSQAELVQAILASPAVRRFSA